ncbi:MAG: hypothetical protein LBS74_09235 [Oscillospiraceae bacterium]|jgi:hypothetical protein|nr:hypothetical protein [Oscillospiraceae bacterium]
MKRCFSVLSTVGVIVFVVFATCYSLNVFKGKTDKYVKGQEYAGGDFAYTGNIHNGLFSGEGEFAYRGGDHYKGGFKNGLFDGKGKFEGREGWSFEGIFIGGKPISGSFILEEDGSYFKEGGESATYTRNADVDTFEGNGWKYIGAFGVRGQDGSGTFNFKDGSTYVGEFVRGYVEGEGVYTDKSGKKVYEGSFKDGKFEGTGKYFSSEGWVYEGLFQDGKFDGEGTLTTTDGTAVRGVWKDGKQVKRYE